MKVPRTFTGISEGVCYIRGAKASTEDFAKAVALNDARIHKQFKTGLPYSFLLKRAKAMVAKAVSEYNSNNEEKPMAKKQTKTDLSAVLASLQNPQQKAEVAVDKIAEHADALVKEGKEKLKKAKAALKQEASKPEPVKQETAPKKPATLKELGITSKPEDLQGVVALAQSLKERLEKGEFEGNHSLTWGAKLWIGNLVRRANKMVESANSDQQAS